MPAKVRVAARQDAACDVDGRMHESKHVSRGEASGVPATQDSRLQGLTDATQACEWDGRKRPCRDSRVEADEQASTEQRQQHSTVLAGSDPCPSLVE